jgi:hypothetical protein
MNANDPRPMRTAKLANKKRIPPFGRNDKAEENGLSVTAQKKERSTGKYPGERSKICNYFPWELSASLAMEFLSQGVKRILDPLVVVHALSPGPAGHPQ